MTEHSLRAGFMPAYNAQPIGMNLKLGEFWVMQYDPAEENPTDVGTVSIHLTVPAYPDKVEIVSHGYFAHLKVYSDGVQTLRELNRAGFLEAYEEIHASTWFDVVQCFAVCGIPVTCHDGELRLVSREMYEILAPTREESPSKGACGYEG